MSETPVIQRGKEDPQPSFKPTKTRGDRGNAYKRARLIGSRTPKDMGIRKTTKKVPWYWANCDHKNKRGKPDCDYSPGRKKFTGPTAFIVMGNKAIHEEAHEKADRRAAEMAGVTT